MRRKALIPGWLGFPLGVTLALLAGLVSNPVWSLLALVAVVDAAAMLTILRAAVATLVVGLGTLGTSAFGHDGLVLLLTGLSALGLSWLLRVDGEPCIPDIPLPRRGDSFG
ncbi:hypothetical protein LWC34_17240 [Kibdelosporangium philippinense]|uniref:Uncharacterized protein n=1 Tax=Kibdelosporangium philippinense TaxID=211113 RepID=A0ABS8ZC04_9PSEU|nr:hypothetical protein [Kibdelosporangium philippinense]MCE7004558.1 hypothetical protein [Kibdelosporangium philippinense]